MPTPDEPRHNAFAFALAHRLGFASVLVERALNEALPVL